MAGPQGRCKGHVINSDSFYCGYPEFIKPAKQARIMQIAEYFSQECACFTGYSHATIPSLAALDHYSEMHHLIQFENYNLMQLYTIDTYVVTGDSTCISLTLPMHGLFQYRCTHFYLIVFTTGIR